MGWSKPWPVAGYWWFDFVGILATDGEFAIGHELVAMEFYGNRFAEQAEMLAEQRFQGAG